MRNNIRKRREYFNERRQKVKDFLREYKSDKVCKICGYDEHSEILNFHHRNPEDKRFGFSDGGMGNLGMKTILEEVEKCDLLCPNCHVWLHYQETAK